MSLCSIQFHKLARVQLCFTIDILIQHIIHTIYLALHILLGMIDVLALRGNIVGSLIHSRILLLQFFIIKYEHMEIIRWHDGRFINTSLLYLSLALLLHSFHLIRSHHTVADSIPALETSIKICNLLINQTQLILHLLSFFRVKIGIGIKPVLIFNSSLSLVGKLRFDVITAAINQIQKFAMVFPKLLLQILSRHIWICILRRIVRLTLVQPHDAIDITLLFISLSLRNCFLLAFSILGIQMLINGIVERILAPCCKLFFRQRKIILTISKYNLSVLTISGKGHVDISITLLHGNCNLVIRLQTAAIKLADKLLRSCILLLSHRIFDVFIKRNRSAYLFNLGIRYLLNHRLSLLIRNDNKGSTIFVSLLQEDLFSAIQSS